MAYGLKTAEIRHLRNLVAQGGAKVEQISNREAGKRDRKSLSAENGGNALLHPVPKVEQRWSKVEQQGGRCSTLKVPPLGGYLGGEWSRPPVSLLRLSR